MATAPFYVVALCVGAVNRHNVIWRREINSNAKSVMKMTTYIGGKSYFADVCVVKSVVKTVIEFAVTSVTKFA